MQTRICKNCEKELPIAFFRVVHQKTKTGEKAYYQTNKCKRCLRINDKDGVLEKYYRPIKDEKKVIRLDKDTIDLIKRIDFMKGYVDTLECFRLINEYQKVFEYNESGIPIEDELCYMWRRLKNSYEKINQK